MKITDDIMGIFTSTIGLFIVIFIICYMYRYRLFKGFREVIRTRGRFNGWISNGNYIKYYTV